MKIKSFGRARVLGLILVLSFFSSAGFTATTPVRTEKDKADNYIRVATMLAGQAKDLRTMTATPKSIKTAISLYSSAGQLFELAAQEYKKLLPQNKATQQEVDNALNGMRFCVGSVSKIKGS